MAEHSPDARVQNLCQHPANRDNVELLVRQLAAPKRVIPFVGAGLSVPLGFPTWRVFLVTSAPDPQTKRAIEACVLKDRFEEAAEELSRALGTRAFGDAIARAFGHDLPAAEPRRGAVDVLPRLTAGPVVTTNFDHVLETVFRDAGAPFECVLWGAKCDLARDAIDLSKRYLVKLHGDALDRSERVLLRSEYSEHYGTSTGGGGLDLEKPLPKLLSQIVLANPLLFVGCSLAQDRTMDLLRQLVEAYPTLTHYAVVERPGDPGGQAARARLLSDHGIRPIWFPPGAYELIAPLLAWVADQAVPADPTPRHQPAICSLV